MKLLDKTVAALGALLVICLVVSLGARMVRDAFPALVLVAVLLLLYRRLWRGRDHW